MGASPSSRKPWSASIEDESQGRPQTVGELTAALKSAVEPRFSAVSVEGEITNCRRPRSGHIYFDVRDDNAVLSCAMWRTQAARAGNALRDGVKVVIEGRIEIYAPHGKYQLIAQRVRESGLGELMAKLEVLKRQLQAEGLFDPALKKPLPPIPRRVGVVTSPSGAAIRDIITTLQDRYPTRVLLAPATVQGPGAPATIAAALGALDAHPEVDVIICGRGGGSLEDLWAFNEEIVARAIAQCETPVVSAVGHEPDVLLSDFVADARAATPTAAAEMVVPDRWDLQHHLSSTRDRMGRALDRRIDQLRMSLANHKARLRDPRRLVTDRRQQVDHLGMRLENAMRSRLGQRRATTSTLAGRLKNLHPSLRLRAGRSQVKLLANRLDGAIARRLAHGRRALSVTQSALAALSPLAVLERGYAVVRTPDGRVLTSATDTQRGELLDVLLHHGAVGVRVEGTRTPDGLETEETE